MINVWDELSPDGVDVELDVLVYLPAAAICLLDYTDAERGQKKEKRTTLFWFHAVMCFHHAESVVRYKHAF